MSETLDQDEHLANMLQEADAVPLLGTDVETFLTWSAALQEAASKVQEGPLAVAAREKAAWFEKKYDQAMAYFNS
jgi:hypothetical protein